MGFEDDNKEFCAIITDPYGITWVETHTMSLPDYIKGMADGTVMRKDGKYWVRLDIKRGGEVRYFRDRIWWVGDYSNHRKRP